MTIFVILAPYGVYALLMLVAPPFVSLFAAALLCLAAVAYDKFRGRSIKMLGLGSTLLFAGLGCYLLLTGSTWNGSMVKFAVDAGLLVIALVSLASGRPFTAQYAREMVDAESARLPGFITANYVITWIWVLAFLLMMLANVLPVYLPGLPLWSSLAIVLAIRYSAVYFTRWYPEYRRGKPAAAPST